MGTEREVEWAGLILGLFASRLLNQRVLRIAGCVLSSLTTLRLEEVNKDVLIDCILEEPTC